MTHEPSPEEEAAARLLADPDFVRRRLNTDLDAVAALQRGSVHLDPQDDLETLVTQLREEMCRSKSSPGSQISPGRSLTVGFFSSVSAR